DFVARCRMAIQLAGLFGVNSIGRVYDVAVNHELAHIVQVTGNRNAFDFLFAPAHLARDDLAIFSNALGMTLRVLILDVNRSGERAYSVFVDSAQAIVQTAILFRAMLYLFQKSVSMYANAYVTSHSADDFTVIRREAFTASFAA